MFHIDLIVGARPNFMKAAPVLRAAAKRPETFRFRLVHTGQHYDEQMNKTFFRDLGLPDPDESLGVGSGTHAEQVARVMVAYEQAVLKARPHATMVVGDVNSTVAAALVSAKLHIPVIHLEAGLRSGDRRMPEEINRLATDAISDLLLTPSRDGDENLLREGVPPERIGFVGNVMIDNLHFQLARAAALPLLSDLGLQHNGGVSTYLLATLHRPSNVDDLEMLAKLVEALEKLALQHPVLFPIHPRTRQRLEEAGLSARLKTVTPGAAAPLAPGLYEMPPLPYNDFLCLMHKCTVVVTDSGGVQEETTALGVPCLTLRDTTERPVTVTVGTNTVIGHDFERLQQLALEAFAGKGKKGAIPEGWDGHAAERVLDVLASYLGQTN